MGASCRCQAPVSWIFSCVLLRVLRMIRFSRRVSATFGEDRTRFYDASELRAPNAELFPPLPAVVAVARRVRRVNSVVVPAFFRCGRRATLICVNLCHLWMFPFFCVLLRVLRMIRFSRRVSLTLGGDRTWFCDASEPRTPNSELDAPLYPLAAIVSRSSAAKSRGPTRKVPFRFETVP